jgi:hypothetical protein
MAVYVDDMHRPARLTSRPARWSHLFADTPEELAAFASRLGLKREWLQHAGTYREHLDVTATTRRRAIQFGAIPICYPRETAALLARKKAAV